MSQAESGARDNRTARPRYSRRYLRRTCPRCRSQGRHEPYTRDARVCADCGKMFFVPPTPRQRERSRRSDEPRPRPSGLNRTAHPYLCAGGRGGIICNITYLSREVGVGSYVISPTSRAGGRKGHLGKGTNAR